MQRYKGMYKERTSGVDPCNRNEKKREILRESRAKQRANHFQSNRVITVSPISVEPNSELSKMSDKENQAQNLLEQNANDKIVNKKMTRSEEYLQRFINWKKKSKEDQNKNAPKGTIGRPNVQQAPFKLSGRGREFKFQMEAQPKTEKFVAPRRPSLYVLSGKFVAAPQSGKMNEPPKAIAKTLVPAKDTLSTAPKLQNTFRPMSTVKSGLSGTNGAQAIKKPNTLMHKSETSAVKPASSVVKNVPNANEPSTSKQAQLQSKSMPASKVVKQPPPTKRSTTTTTTSTTVKTSLPNPAVKPQSTLPQKSAYAVATNRMPPTNIVMPPIIIPAGFKSNAKAIPNVNGGGAVAKFKKNNDRLKPAAVRSNVNSQLTKSMKPKKDMGVKKQQKLQTVPNLKADLIAAVSATDPPLEISHKQHPFQALATSSHLKSNDVNAQLLENIFYNDISAISPVVAQDKKPLLSAKRKLLPEEGSNKKFNFVRFSETGSLFESTRSEHETLQPDNDTASAGDEVTLKSKTPSRESAGETNYLSPYVSVTRGKVNSRVENERRNSMYLQDQEQPQSDVWVEVRRTLESVTYFRLQLQNEIKRLNLLCDEWQAYSNDQEALLSTTGGIDMINATIGQTKLLTTKKLMQFSMLIDRCEAGATGIGAQPDDGSEDTKPVQSEDLEGWWDMVRLQCENIDKRFQNLERWKANNWQDPDTISSESIKPKKKRIVKRQTAKATTAKPTSNLKQFLRKAYAERRKNQLVDPEATERASIDSSDATMVPSKRNSHCIVVRDRKYFSPTRTILGMPNAGHKSSENGRRSIGGKRSSIIGDSHELLKAAIMANVEKNEKLACTPPKTTQHEGPALTSILKTPGTAKRGLHGVLFSAKKKIRKFQFTFDDPDAVLSDDECAAGVDKLEDVEEDMSAETLDSRHTPELNSDQNGNASDADISRTYTLRNRKVKLRPSSEFM